jgi:hypothetical protein
VIAPPYAPLLQRLRGSLPALVAEVAHDVALPGEDPADVALAVGPVVRWMLDALAEAELMQPERLAVLHDEGARAATAGDSLQRLLDRYLSTGWVVWGAATREALDQPTVAALGTALLKAGDAAAASIAAGFGEAERSLALRAAGARREFVDELLDLEPGDSDAAARVRRRAADFGLDPAASYRVTVATLGREIGDGSIELVQLAEALAPVERALPRRPGSTALDRRASPPFVAGRRGRVVVIMPTGDLPPGLGPALERVAPDGWLAVLAPPAAGLSRLAEAYGTAIDALAVAARLGRTGLVNADDVLLERALLADEPLLAAAVAQELGPILGASRNAAGLLATLEAYVESAENLRATARRLGLAPRTVAYRLARIEALLGEPVRGARLVRIATALLAARLLPPHTLEAAAGAHPERRVPSRVGGVRAEARRTPANPDTPPSSRGTVPARPSSTGPAEQPRQVPRGRSQTRRGRGTET